MNTKLARDRYQSAANIVKYSVKVWYLKRKYNSNSILCLSARQRLFKFIYSLKEIKKEQGSLIDSCTGFYEVISMERRTHIEQEKSRRQIGEMKNEIKNIEVNLNRISQQMDELQTTLKLFVNK